MRSILAKYTLRKRRIGGKTPPKNNSAPALRASRSLGYPNLETIGVYYLWFALAAAFSVISLGVNIASDDLFRHNGGDIWIYQVWIRCFAEQFWQGDIYPRWCMDVNAGLGTPLFLFYFPLTHYLAALFYPLVMAGLGEYPLFIFLCGLASFATVITCYLWLRDLVKPSCAAVASMLFLCMPYRMEMVYFRSALSEMVCMALLPLIFLRLRRMAQGEGGLLTLGALLGLALLTHVPLAAGGMIMGGIYIAFMTRLRRRSCASFAGAALLGTALAAFYLVPGAYYRQYLAGNVLAQGLYGWPNNFLAMGLVAVPGLERPLFAVLLTMLLLLLLSIGISGKATNNDNDFIEREKNGWLLLGWGSMALVFSFSAPLYALLGPLQKVVFPWRMQAFTTLSLAYMLAAWLQWHMPEKRLRTWKADAAVLVLLLWATGAFLTSGFTPRMEAYNEALRAARIVFAPEYRTRWTDPAFADHEFLLGRSTQSHPRVEIAEGEGELELLRWGWQGIEMRVKSKKPTVVRINHTYFPVWSARLYKGEAVALRAERKTGLMLAFVPGGEHILQLKTEVAREPLFLPLSQWLSGAAWLGLVLFFAVRKIFDSKNVK